ncbi:unnamed protein product [Arabis nemorensis]|uniref:Cell division control protein 45 homolog n=1 Tax=Arabis nemorensis TaxID=586526 RepID=A0A565BI84_9BRAS|nr:unnamed protein product [Arabis nemorensis]
MVRLQKVESFYTQLRESASSSSSQNPLLIFPSSSDVDSLCTLKIITHVLESDSIQYSCFPVSSFLEIHKYAGQALCSSSDGNSSPVTILLINWGCHRDLRFVLGLGSAARVFVVDSHRPIHLHNLSDENHQVIVLYTDDDERQADLAYDFDVLKLANESFHLEEESDDDYESGSESQNGDGDRSSKSRRWC